MTEIRLDGEAQLCFPPDGSWFQGHLVTDDECLFTIKAVRCVSPSPPPSETTRLSNCTVDGTEDQVTDVYKLNIHDHEQMVDYTIDRVTSKGCKSSRILRSENVDFESTSFYRGQKAELMIQRCLPFLVGHNLHMYVGPMKIKLTQEQINGISLIKWTM